MNWISITIALFAVLVALYVWMSMKQRRIMTALVLVKQPEAGVKKPPCIPFVEPLVANLLSVKEIFLILKDLSRIIKALDEINTQDVRGSLELGMNQGFFGSHSVNIWNVEVAKEVLNDKLGIFHKLDIGVLENFLSESVLNVQGERWRKQRAILSPAFRIQHLRALLPSIYKVGDELLKRLESFENQPVLMADWMHKATLEIIGQTGFGHSFGALGDTKSENMKNYEALMAEFTNVIHVIAPRIAKITGRTKILNDLISKFGGWMIELIQEKRDKLQKEQEEGLEGDRDATDILEVMVRAHDDENGSLTDKELIHNMNTFFIAGHETTSGAIVNTLHLLAAHPEIQAKVAEEIMREAPESKASNEQLKSMELLEACLKESMRLFPPAPVVSRQTSEDTVLGGYHVPKGTLLSVHAFATHRNPTHWKNPDEFNPQRFLDGSSRDTFLYLPFSKGSRMCIGVNFAMLEMRALLSQLLVKYEFYVDPSDPAFRPHIGTLLSVDPAVPLRFRPRLTA